MTPTSNKDVYTREVTDVIAREADYLRERREKSGIPVNDLQDLTALCISGGGVRAATLALGMMQAFIRHRIMERFDYMSTVSGGGYMGACLSSLMSEEEDFENLDGQFPINNDKFDVSQIGLQPENSPLVALHDDKDYSKPKETQLSARHQVHHLRTHGEYLTPNKSILSWDVMRAAGSLFSGIFSNFLLILSLLMMFVAVHHFLFFLISDGTFFNLISKVSVKQTDASALNFFNYLSEWYEISMKRNVQIIGTTLWQNPVWGLGFFALGMLITLFTIATASRLPMRIAQAEYEERHTDKAPNIDPKYRRNAGFNLQAAVTHDLRRLFNLISFLAGPVLAYITVITMTYVQGTDFNYWLIFTLPFSFSFGMFIAAYSVIPTFELTKFEHSQGRLFRSLFTGMQGSALYGLLLSILMPIILLFVFNTSVSTDFFLTVVSVVSAYYVLITRFGSKEATTLVNRLIQNFQRPLINLSIFVFLTLALLGISSWMLRWNDSLNSEVYSPWIGGMDGEINFFSLMILGIAILLFYIVGLAANVNKMSLHYFYRDRLSEAYLRTDARVKRPEKNDFRLEAQGMPLINLRNHVPLLLKNVGEGNGKAPYHIIVAALNLQGSNDLVKRSLKADHFIFSKYFVGSNTTGFMATDKYRRGFTRLSIAMTISAAAVSSGMGNLSFAAQYFFMTLFNLRTGYWIQNPWHEYIRYAKLKPNMTIVQRIRRRLGNILTLGRTFWPYYMLKELSGGTTARTYRVNVSDGGHTGDNLGLVPMLERKCKKIVVCDFEEDPEYNFASFNHAVRIAFTDMNIRIDIDLEELLPGEAQHDIEMSDSCVATGDIFYPDGTKGELIYIKSCLSTPPNGDLPITLFNYARQKEAFPHESTSDQYFDDAQFEAYRVLGDHLASQAVASIVQDIDNEVSE